MPISEQPHGVQQEDSPRTEIKDVEKLYKQIESKRAAIFLLQNGLPFLLRADDLIHGGKSLILPLSKDSDFDFFWGEYFFTKVASIDDGFDYQIHEFIINHDGVFEGILIGIADSIVSKPRERKISDQLLCAYAGVAIPEVRNIMTSNQNILSDDRQIAEVARDSVRYQMMEYVVANRYEVLTHLSARLDEILVQFCQQIPPDFLQLASQR